MIVASSPRCSLEVSCSPDGIDRDSCLRLSLAASLAATYHHPDVSDDLPRPHRRQRLRGPRGARVHPPRGPAPHPDSSHTGVGVGWCARRAASGYVHSLTRSVDHPALEYGPNRSSRTPTEHRGDSQSPWRISIAGSAPTSPEVTSSRGSVSPTLHEVVAALCVRATMSSRAGGDALPAMVPIGAEFSVQAVIRHTHSDRSLVASDGLASNPLTRWTLRVRCHSRRRRTPAQQTPTTRGTHGPPRQPLAADSAPDRGAPATGVTRLQVELRSDRCTRVAVDRLANRRLLPRPRTNAQLLDERAHGHRDHERHHRHEEPRRDHRNAMDGPTVSNTTCPCTVSLDHRQPDLLTTQAPSQGTPATSASTATKPSLGRGVSRHRAPRAPRSPRPRHGTLPNTSGQHQLRHYHGERRWPGGRGWRMHLRKVGAP